MKLSIETIEKLKKLKRDKNWDELIGDLVDQFEDWEEDCDKELGREKPAVVGGKVVGRTVGDKASGGAVSGASRHIPNAIRRYAIRQTGGLCAYPGCGKRFASLHHTKRFAIYREHDPDHIHPVCDGHERILHQGLVKNEEESPAKWRVRMEADCGAAEAGAEASGGAAAQARAKYWVDKKVQKYRCWV